MPNQREIRHAVELADAARDITLTCHRSDACALSSPLMTMADAAFAASTKQQPSHRIALLERGSDALLARIHLIRSARRSIELQSYIFAQDDVGLLVLDELLAAARRGVRVRVLFDQLFSVEDASLMARLATAHANFELRLYNPTFGAARTGPVRFVAGILCCFFRFNQRMHNKLLLVDGKIGITGGRNYQNRYFDWDPDFNYRDRDVLVAGPVVEQMLDSFEIFWRHPRSIPVAALKDVLPRLRGPGNKPSAAPIEPTHNQRILDMSAQADDAQLIHALFVVPAHAVSRVEYPSDLPNKPLEGNSPYERNTTAQLRALLAQARDLIVLQTPYLVLSGRAKTLFRQLHRRASPPTVIVSTNSLASTDAFPVYALSHKYKRTYLRDFGFQIHELKPFPADVPIDLAATGALGNESARYSFSESQRAFGSGARGSSGPVPLKQAGVRIGLHAKSLVIDDRIAMVGTHNFDPRSDKFNTESALVIYDEAVAAELQRNILADAAPDNSWTIARRPSSPVLPGLQYSLAKLFEALPLFDFWPWRYATSYAIKPGCQPLPPNHPHFRQCYQPVGDFPEVNLKLKAIYTRILTAFGAGLAPIL